MHLALHASPRQSVVARSSSCVCPSIVGFGNGRTITRARPHLPFSSFAPFRLVRGRSSAALMCRIMTGCSSLTWIVLSIARYRRHGRRSAAARHRHIRQHRRYLVLGLVWPQVGSAVRCGIGDASASRLQVDTWYPGRLRSTAPATCSRAKSPLKLGIGGTRLRRCDHELSYARCTAGRIA